MNVTDVMQRLQGVFDATFIDSVQVTESLDAHQVEEWDSLTHISLVVAIEQEFGIRFRTGDVEGADNVGELAQLIAQRAGGEVTA